MLSIILPPPETHTPPMPAKTRGPVPVQRPTTFSQWRGIAAGIFVLVPLLWVVLLATGVTSTVNTIGGSAIVSDQYYHAIRDRDYARAYGYLGAHMQATFSLEAFTREAQQQDAIAGKVSRYTYIGVPIGDPAAVTITITRANGISYAVYLKMHQENDVWKVSSFNRI